MCCSIHQLLLVLNWCFCPQQLHPHDLLTQIPYQQHQVIPPHLLFCVAGMIFSNVSSSTSKIESSSSTLLRKHHHHLTTTHFKSGDGWGRINYILIRFDRRESSKAKGAIMVINNTT
mmetsp:Transcript_22471/g.32180  ORF Transcript_22471/g.32180 Transcript_22471/m.32180 type:complete len:117 (-) Transcript_22471:1628-1978(-)